MCRLPTAPVLCRLRLIDSTLPTGIHRINVTGYNQNRAIWVRHREFGGNKGSSCEFVIPRTREERHRQKGS